MNSTWKKILTENSKRFSIQKNLNTKLWSDNKLYTHIALRLKQIANDFIKSFEFQIPIEDITFTGSLANYNWTNNSDIDLHIVVNFDKIPEKFLDGVKDYFQLKKNEWNENHSITVSGFPVEIYVQDIDEQHYSTGIWSIKNNKWIEEPKKDSVEIDYEAITKKASDFIEQINQGKQFYTDKQYNKCISFLDKVRDKIKRFRKSGLEENGEMSTENLVFKTLRSDGYIDLLNKIKRNAYDKMMSLKENKSNWFSYLAENQELIIREISAQEIERLKDYTKEIKPGLLSFDNIFGDKYRLVFPFEDAGNPEEENSEIGQIISFFNKNGYKVDLSKGLISREVSNKFGTQIRQEKIGKFFQKLQDLDSKYGTLVQLMDVLLRQRTKASNSNLDNSQKEQTLLRLKKEEEKIQETQREINSQFYAMLPSTPEISPGQIEDFNRFWNTKSEFYIKNASSLGDSYSIVLSRSPIDVLRMSDFEDIESCHSYGKSEYECAVDEARGEGLVAYVTKTSDLQNIQGNQEIFSDKDRNIEGITPVSRVRVRKFSIEDPETKQLVTIAIPEQRIYGKRFPNLVSTLEKIMLNLQRDSLPKQKPNIDKAKLHGGSYTDTSPSFLVKNFLNKAYGSLNESEPYQDYVHKEHPKWMKNLTQNGGNKVKTPPYVIKTTTKRGKSAPPSG